MGLLDCVVQLWISWLQAWAYCYSVWRGHVVLLLPHAVSGNKSGICGTLCWYNPGQCITHRCLSAGIFLLHLYLLFSFGFLPLMVSVFVGVRLFHLSSSCPQALLLFLSNLLLQSSVSLFPLLLSHNVIFMMVLNRAKGIKETPRRIWKSFCYPCSKFTMRKRE